MILLLYIFEQLRKFTSNIFYLSIAYVAFFILVLCLDGVLFPSIAFAFNPNLIDIVIGGVKGKFIMASAYSLPVLLFLFVYRDRLTRYIEHPPLKWSLLLTSSEKLMREMQAQEGKLKQSAAVFANTREGIVVTDPELTIISCNNAFARLFGVDVDRDIKNRPTLLSLQVVDDDRYAEMRQLLPQSGHWQGEVASARDSEPAQSQLLSINAVKDDAGKLINYVGVFTDITRRKLVEQERERFISELQDSNLRLERFAYTISHELKTPLVTIAGFSGMLRQDFAEGEYKQLDTHLRQIESAATEMSMLLEDLLKLAHLGYVKNELEPVSLSELADRARNLLQFHVANLGVDIDIADDMPVVMADRNRLLEVLQNLMENAIKFSADVPMPRIIVSAEEAGTEIICSVQDNGSGIAPAYHERIFNMFERLDPKIEGTGVGLALVRGIVESHGGRIWVESEGDGNGSTFRFSLPR